MSAKAIIAIVAVLAIAGGIGAAVFYTQYANQLDVDVPKESGQLVVKDYYLGNVSGTVTYDESEPTNKGYFLQYLYFVGGLKDTTKEITYKGTAVVCDVYLYAYLGKEYTFYNEPTSGVTYYYSILEGEQLTKFTLKDTNLDLTKTEAAQEISSGSYYKYDYSAPVPDLGVEMKGEYEYRMTGYDTSTNSGTMNTSLNGKIDSDVKYTIKEFNSAGRVVTKEESKIMTKDDYLSVINYNSFIKYAEDEGYKVTYESKSSDTIDTEFGKRKVTIEKIKLTRDDEIQNFTLTYGEKGFIYKEDLSTVYDGNELNATFVLKETNLIVK